MHNQSPVLVSSRLAVGIRVAVVRTVDGNRESRIQECRGGQLPSSEYRVEKTVGAAAEGSTSAVRQFVYTDEVQAMANIHTGRTVIGVAVVTVLIGTIRPVNVGRAVVARRVRHSLG